MKIKICGLSSEEDVRYANVLHVDYAGFVFSPSRNPRRQVTAERARELCDMLDPHIKSVGVFADESAEFINRTADFLYAVQIHGDCENIGMCEREIWRAINLGNDKDISLPPPPCMILADSSAPGSGKTFDVSLLKDFPKDREFILAGGLNPENVKGILESLLDCNIIGVDVSSGVETESVKDLRKMREFVEAVRDYEREYEQ